MARKAALRGDHAIWESPTYLVLVPLYHKRPPLLPDDQGAERYSQPVAVLFKKQVGDMKPGAVALVGLPGSLTATSIQWLLQGLNKQPNTSFSNTRADRYPATATLDANEKNLLATLKKGLKEDRVRAGSAYATRMTYKQDTGTTLSGVTYHLEPKDLKTHSLDDIHGVVQAALTDARTTWNWRPKDLRIYAFGGTSRVMGRAYNPGQGDHRVSLNRKLLNNYDLAGIARVVIHELCHHYREERWPRNPRVFKTQGAHDSRFCSELAKIDPLVNENNCEVFDDVTAAVGGSEKLPPGVLTAKLLKTKFKLIWIPDKGKDIVFELSPAELDALVMRYPGDPKQAVVYDHPASKFSMRISVFGAHVQTDPNGQDYVPLQVILKWLVIREPRLGFQSVLKKITGEGS